MDILLGVCIGLFTSSSPAAVKLSAVVPLEELALLLSLTWNLRNPVAPSDTAAGGAMAWTVLMLQAGLGCAALHLAVAALCRSAPVWRNFTSVEL